jgi:hypothetical protein
VRHQIQSQVIRINNATTKKKFYNTKADVKLEYDSRPSFLYSKSLPLVYLFICPLRVLKYKKTDIRVLEHLHRDAGAGGYPI